MNIFNSMEFIERAWNNCYRKLRCGRLHGLLSQIVEYKSISPIYSWGHKRSGRVALLLLTTFTKKTAENLDLFWKLDSLPI